MLRTLGDAGYLIEWRVVNAAEYGFPQRRIRVFIIAKKQKSIPKSFDALDYIVKGGILARALPVNQIHLNCSEVEIDKDVEKVSKYFNKADGAQSPFFNSGVFVNGVAYTLKTEARQNGVVHRTLGDVLQKDSEVDEEFYIPDSQLKEWKFLKGAKSIERIHKQSGTKYKYAEGSMAFPDLLTNPSRTILTGEGGTSPSRFKHIIKTSKGYRRLTPIELERLNGFPDNWTSLDANQKKLSDAKRAFFMGNALVVGLIEKVGNELAKELTK
jgi:DNA (cytosine-5)-methyltransferase 1